MGFRPCSGAVSGCAHPPRSRQAARNHFLFIMHIIPMIPRAGSHAQCGKTRPRFDALLLLSPRVALQRVATDRSLSLSLPIRWGESRGEGPSVCSASHRLLSRRAELALRHLCLNLLIWAWFRLCSGDLCPRGSSVALTRLNLSWALMPFVTVQVWGRPPVCQFTEPPAP